MILSGQTIRSLGIFDPFHERSLHEETGMSFGLGPAGYDVRVRETRILRPGDFALFSTIETFDIPIWLLASVHDKSTMARLGLALQNTIAEPGWRGSLTLEVSNHGEMTRKIVTGQPIAQVIFHVLDMPAEQPYRGRYQNQPPRAVPAIHAQPGQVL